MSPRGGGEGAGALQYMEVRVRGRIQSKQENRSKMGGQPGHRGPGSQVKTVPLDRSKKMKPRMDSWIH